LRPRRDANRPLWLDGANDLLLSDVVNRHTNAAHASDPSERPTRP
jgi:hypothetical protein